MESVKVFNAELSALYESKPPVSRAKMAQLTKSAIKAIKFYKHVVQSVEKFIMKCRPEYKVPGLYVIDSIVRQSRHQFSIEKDVFAPRFTKNITVTFQHLYKCPAEDKSKIVRVLNLWQKNSVFPSEVIQPLMDLAPDPTNPAAMERVQQAVNAALGARMAAKQVNQQQDHANVQQEKQEGDVPAQVDGSSHQNDVLKTVTQLLQQSQDAQSLSDQNQQLQQLQLLQQQLVLQTQLLQQPDQEEQPVIDSNLLTQIQQLTAQLLNKSQEEDEEEPAFNKKLLDFDYGESDDEEINKASPAPQNNIVEANTETGPPIPDLINQRMAFGIQHQSNIGMINNQVSAVRLDQAIPMPVPVPVPSLNAIDMHPVDMNPAVEEGEIPDSNENEMGMEDNRRDRRRHRRSRSRSRTRGRRSRSRSRDRRRSRSRDRDRYSKRSRDRDRERDRERQREKERERKKMGLPPIKEEHVSICSTTLWIGHLNKHTTEEDLTDALSKYSEVVNMALVVPRGCAYVTLSKRRDAARALDRMKGAKLLGNTLKAAWAMGAGVRESSLKEKWDMDLGVTYLPWATLAEVQLEKISDGAIIDEDSLPEKIRKEREQQQELLDSQGDPNNPPAETSTIPQQPLPSVSAAVPGMMSIMPLGGMPPMISMPPLGIPPPAVRSIIPTQLVPGIMPRGPPTIMTPRLPTSTALIPGSQAISSSGEIASEAEAMLSKMGVPPDSAGISLQQAIQNIVNNSAAITAVAESGQGPTTVIHQLPVHAVHPHTIGPPMARLPVPVPAGIAGQVTSTSVGIRLLGTPGKPTETPENQVSMPNGPQPGIRLNLPIQGPGSGLPPSLLHRDPVRGPSANLRMEIQNRPPLMTNSPQRPMVLLNQRFPGDRGNTEGTIEMNSDISSLIDNQVPPFHGPPGGPIRTVHPRFAMRSPGRHMRPRGPPPFGHNVNFVDFPPFPGPRHRGDFGGRGGRGRGFGGGRGDHGHRHRPSVDMIE